MATESIRVFTGPNPAERSGLDGAGTRGNAVCVFQPRAALVRRYPLTVGLIAGMGGTWLLTRLAPSAAARWRWAASTTVAHLARHPARVLVGSVPWVPAEWPAVWFVLALLGVGTLEVTVGPALALVVVFLGHAGATAVSEGVLGFRVLAGNLPRSALDVLDVGPSYVIVSALAAVAVLPARPPFRVACALAVAVAGPALLEGITRGDLTATGHVAALVVGVLAGAATPVRRRARGSSGGQPDAGRS